MDGLLDSPKTADGRALGKLELFLGFAEMGLCGFGGVASFARHVIVDRRKWLTEHDYAALLGMGQILPGGNIINMTVMLGDRFQGPLGAIAALSGLLVMPIVILLGLTLVYDSFSSNPDVKAATVGAGAAAAGLVLGVGLRMGLALRLRPLHLAFAAATFVAMGLLRLPFFATIIVLAPACILATWWSDRR
jgi:chromate transporter